MSITLRKAEDSGDLGNKEPDQLSTGETYITKNGSILYVTEDCDGDNVWIVLHLEKGDTLLDGSTDAQDVKVVSIVMEVV